jgi:hypothetical protein
MGTKRGDLELKYVILGFVGAVFVVSVLLTGFPNGLGLEVK